MPDVLVIGLDASTTGVKAIAFDRHGSAVAGAQRPLALRMPRPGWHEQDAEEWWTASAAALREVAEQVDPNGLAGLAIAHQRETFVPVDETGRALGPALVWMDERARALLPGLQARYGAERFHQLTGKPLSGNLSLGKLLWLRENRPQLFDAAHQFLDTHAFLVRRLTGRLATGWGSADPMGLFDMRAHTWAGEILDGIGLAVERLPALYPPGARLGGVGAEAAAACGLPAGLPVICGLGDGQAAGLGAGITGPGAAYLNLGTAVVSGTYSAGYLAGRAFRTTCGGVPGTYLLETVLLGGTYTVSWFLREFAGTRAGAETEEEWEAAAAGLPPGAEGLMLLPYWNSAMNPYWDAAASGAVVGWRGSHGPAHLYRAILEGIAFEQRLAAEGVGAATGRPVNAYAVMGGGSRSALWRQLVADVGGVPIYRCGSHEASTLGAAILAAAGAGLFPGVGEAAAAMAHLEPEAQQPDPARHAIYSRLYEEVYRHLFPALQPYLDRLTELAEQI